MYQLKICGETFWLRIVELVGYVDIESSRDTSKLWSLSGTGNEKSGMRRAGPRVFAEFLRRVDALSYLVAAR